MQIRTATDDDAQGMSRVLQEIIAQTGRQRPSNTGFVLDSYIANPQGLCCSVAVDEAQEILGFQSLIRAVAGNAYDVPEGWGIIGTHISPRAHRRGVGKALFASSKDAARQAGLTRIDAYIGADNMAALRYYDAMGFQTYREPDGVVQKAYVVGVVES